MMFADWIQSISIIVLGVSNVLMLKTFVSRGKRLNEDCLDLQRQWAEFQQRRAELYERLADPATIEADFERSARAREMRDAQRDFLPRDGAGPPAKVHRAKMRGAAPGNWRVQRP